MDSPFCLIQSYWQQLHKQDFNDIFSMPLQGNQNRGSESDDRRWSKNSISLRYAALHSWNYPFIGRKCIGVFFLFLIWPASSISESLDYDNWRRRFQVSFCPSPTVPHRRPSIVICFSFLLFRNKFGLHQPPVHGSTGRRASTPYEMWVRLYHRTLGWNTNWINKHVTMLFF